MHVYITQEAVEQPTLLLPFLELFCQLCVLSRTPDQMPQVVQYTKSETCQKSIKCAVQSLWNPFIFSKSCLKVKCRSVLGWPRLKVPWVSQLLPQSSSFVWDGISGKKTRFLLRNQEQSITTKVAALVINNQVGDERWQIRFLLTNKLVYQQKEFYTKQRLYFSRK